MWWKWILRGVLAISSNPAVQQWARRQAAKLIERAIQDHAQNIADLHAAVGLEVPRAPEPPRPHVVKMIRTQQDTLKPGMVVVVDGTPFQIRRLLTVSPKEATYEAESL